MHLGDACAVAPERVGVGEILRAKTGTDIIALIIMRGPRVDAPFATE
jgi:hypothetical protein